MINDLITLNGVPPLRDFREILLLELKENHCGNAINDSEGRWLHAIGDRHPFKYPTSRIHRSMVTFLCGSRRQSWEFIMVPNLKQNRSLCRPGFSGYLLRGMSGPLVIRPSVPHTSRYYCAKRLLRPSAANLNVRLSVRLRPSVRAIFS